MRKRIAMALLLWLAVPALADQITLKNGEPAVVAGSVSRSEQKTLGGIPGFGQIPLLNKVTANNTKEDDVDELLVVITPHVLNSANSNAGPEIWLSTAK